MVQALTMLSSGWEWYGANLSSWESAWDCRWKGLIKYSSVFVPQLVVLLFFFFNPFLREICDYIFFSAQVLECIAQIQTYPTS